MKIMSALKGWLFMACMVASLQIAAAAPLQPFQEKSTKSSTTSKTAKSSKASKSTKSSKASKATKSAKSSSKSAKSAASTGLININSASLETLKQLPRIGDVIGKRIIDFRKKHGGFKSKEELMNVSGIGEKTYQNLKSKIRI